MGYRRVVLFAVCCVLAPQASAQRFHPIPENSWVFETLLNFRNANLTDKFADGILRFTPDRIQVAGYILYIQDLLNQAFQAIDADVRTVLRKPLSYREWRKEMEPLRDRIERFASLSNDVLSLVLMTNVFASELRQLGKDPKEIAFELRALLTKNGELRNLIEFSGEYRMSQFPPVPSGHWVHDALEGGENKGYFFSYPDRWFRGERALLARGHERGHRWDGGTIAAQASEFGGAAGVLQGTISPETSSTFLIVEAKSKDKTVDARLYLPSTFHRREKETLGYLSLTNRAPQEKLLINGAWAYTNVYPSRLDGEPLYKPMILSFQGPLPTRAQISVGPGNALLRSFPLQHLWDFMYTEEGRYKLELIYNDAGLWPAEQQRHTVGKIRLGFDLVVEQSIVKFVQTEPKKTS